MYAQPKDFTYILQYQWVADLRATITLGFFPIRKYQ